MRRSREEEEAEHRQQVPELAAAVGFGLAALDARVEEGEGRNVSAYLENKGLLDPDADFWTQRATSQDTKTLGDPAVEWRNN